MVFHRALAWLQARRLGNLEVPNVDFSLQSLPESTMFSTRDLANCREFLIQGAHATAYVQHKPPQSFCYEVPGKWIWGNEAGGIQAADDAALVGVMLLPPVRHQSYAGSSVFEKAAHRSTMEYESIFNQQVVDTKLENLAAGRLTAMLWTACVGDTTVERFFVDIGEEWIIQVTTAIHPSSTYSSSTIYEQIVNTFSATSKAEGFLPTLDERCGKPLPL